MLYHRLMHSNREFLFMFFPCLIITEILRIQSMVGQNWIWQFHSTRWYKKHFLMSKIYTKIIGGPNFYQPIWGIIGQILNFGIELMKEKNRVFHCIGLTNWTAWDSADRVASIRGVIYSNKKMQNWSLLVKFWASGGT